MKISKPTIFLLIIISCTFSCKNDKSVGEMPRYGGGDYKVTVEGKALMLEGLDYFTSNNMDIPSDSNKVVYTSKDQIEVQIRKPERDLKPVKVFLRDEELINSAESNFVLNLPEELEMKLKIETGFRKPFFFYVIKEKDGQKMKNDTLSKNLANSPCAELKFNGLVNEVKTYEWTIEPDTINSECCAYQPNYELVKSNDASGCVMYEWKKKATKNPKPDKPNMDSDGDGVIDRLDKCPDERGESKYDGCPPPTEDRDGDGVIDRLDKCPDEPGESEYDGCPPQPVDTDKDGIPDSDDKCPKVKGSKDHQGCPPPIKKFVPKSVGITGELLSAAALDDEDELRTRGSIIIAPLKDLILYEVKLVASNDGKIEFMLEGPGIKNMELIKNCNTGHNTIRFNDLKNTVLRGGNTYTLIYSAIDDVKVKQIKKSYAKGTANGDVSMSGKMIFYDIKYKF